MTAHRFRAPLRMILVLPALLALLGGCRALAPADGPISAAPATAAPATAIAITAPPQDWQVYLGQRVRIDAPLTISGNRDWARRGELIASFDGRLFAPTEIARPGVDAARVAAGNARRQLRLVDALAGDRAGAIATWRSGGIITQAEGRIVAQGKGHALQLDTPMRVHAAARPTAPQIAGDVRLASFNLENLFNGDGRGGGFPTLRGARTPQALVRQLGKLVATIHALQPDVAALMELENDGYGDDSSVAALVDALNAAASDGPGDWRFVNTGTGPGDNPIRVGMIYRASRVTPTGQPAVLQGGPFGERSRVPLAQAFRAGRGPVFVVVANHFKSKGCTDAVGADADQHDGQACWNALRTDSARRLGAWLKTDPTETGSDLVAIVGDFNAYAMEDPIQALLGQGWRDALHVARVADPYSFVFDARAGRLDHALLSPAMARRVAAAAEWHSNADEVEKIDDHAVIGAENPPTPWRSSDHDPLLVGLRLRAP